MIKKIYKIQDNKKYFDLVCGMELGKDEVKYTTKYAGQKYHFCDISCLRHFIESPQRYVPDYKI